MERCGAKVAGVTEDGWNGQNMRMKPTVGVDQCFILLLESGKPTHSDDTLCLIERLRHFAQELAIPSHTVDPPLLQTNDVETVLRVAMRIAKSKGIPKLLIAGGTLEKDVTVIAMNGLAEGFDVYLLGDTFIQTDSSYSNLYWNRLIQAGCVPTTMIQMIAEWIASDADAAKSQKIKSNAERFDLIENY